MKVHVISPWYPDYASPYSGIFVEKQVRALRAMGHTVSVEVPQIFPAPAGPIPIHVIQAMERLGAAHPARMYHSVGSVTYIPAPVPSRSGFMGRASSFAASIELKRRVMPTDADITHAHLGVPTGWAAIQLGSAPIVVTEHQSTLAEVLSEPAARNAYKETIESVDAFICVSPHLRDQIGDAFGRSLSDGFEIIPNIVDVDHIRFDPPDKREFKSWIYVGSLSIHKGVEKLLRSFVVYRRRIEPAATLVLVGDGPLRPWIERFRESTGMHESIHMVGALPHGAIGEYLASADVMVHLSPNETFGIASLEAIAAGLPVVSVRNAGAESTWGGVEEACGLLVDADSSPSEVARSVADLKDDQGRLRPESGRRMVEEIYHPQVVAKKLTHVYERCLART